MTCESANRILLFLLAFFFVSDGVIAQNFHLVKDINTSTNSNPSNFNYSANGYSFEYTTTFAVLNGVGYFGADDGVHGTGFWRSDGTAEGTYQVKDSVSASSIIAANGRLFFAGSGKTGLWTSDGTEEGTFPVLNSLPAGLTSFSPYTLTGFNGAVFVAISTVNGEQLWKTDGTHSGTVLVKDYYDQDYYTTGRRLANFKVAKGKLYFTVESYSSGSTRSKLWVTDGSASGTYVISNNLMDPAQIFERSADPLDNVVYFTATTSNFTRSLYYTDGNPGVVQAAYGFNKIISSTSSQHLLNRDGTIYFLGNETPSSGNQNLYKFKLDGSNGVLPVKVVTGSSSSGTFSGILDMAVVNNNIFFSLQDVPDNKYQLWKTDGTPDGNILLKDSLYTSNFMKLNGLLFFSANHPAYGPELWKSDGTVNGTSLVKDIIPGTVSSNPSGLTPVNDKILFSADDNMHGWELWQSDGTTGGTSLLKDINQNSTASSNPYSITPFNNLVIFDARSGNNENARLWKTDGTESGTQVINDTIYKPGYYQDTLTVRNNEVYFWGNSLSGRAGLYKTNGTSQGTVMIKDFTDSSYSVYATIATDSLVYFYLFSYNSNKYEIWRTDGTNANTFRVITNAGPGYFSSNMLVAAGNTLFFAPLNSKTLWKSDGTVAGTVLLKTFNYADPGNMKAHKGSLYFTNYSGSTNELWKSDGTPAGTVKVTSKVASPANFASSNGELFFSAIGNIGVYDNVGRELFKTDGSDEGTVLVKDIHPGYEGTNISSLYSFNGLLYFFTEGSQNGTVELWKSDGSAEGTQLVALVNGGTDYAPPPNRVVSGNGKMFFAFNRALWQSDGTQNGTYRVIDDNLTGVTLDHFNSNVTSTGGQLFFGAFSYQYGGELYAGVIKGAAIQNYISAGNGNWNNPATWVGNAVPPPGANVLVLHNVVANMDATCNELRVEAPGGLTVNEGVRITLLQ